MPAVFDDLGIRFEYPENWSADAVHEADGSASVTVASEETGFWNLNIYPSTMDPSTLLDNVLSTMRTEYPQLEADTAEEQVEGLPLCGYELSFFYLDLVSTACVRAFRRDDATYLLMYQAEDRELERIGPVFRAMTVSLLRDLQNQPG